MKVYVLYTGCTYPDDDGLTVAGVFSSKRKANDYKRKHPLEDEDDSYFGPEEFDLDMISEKENK